MYISYDSIGAYVQLETLDFALNNAGEMLFSNLRSCFQIINQTYQGKRVVFPSFPNNTVTLKVNVDNDYISAKMPPEVDFNNQTFIVLNGRTNNLFLFEWSTQPTDLSHKVSKGDIDSGNFSHISELKDDMVLLTVTDNHFWTSYTGGNSPTSKYRKDIFLLNQGHAINSPVFPYSTNGTYQTCHYCPANNTLKIFKNIKVLRKRDQPSNYVTNLLKVEYQNNVLIENVYVGFDDGYGYCGYNADQCFKVYDSTNILFRNVNVFGTYSNISSYGYAFYLNNIWNCKFENVTAFGNWGVFGCNNMNKFQLYQCTLNRVDLHCYGRDIYCRDCIFSPATRTRLNDAYNEIIFKPNSALTILQYPDSNYPDDTTVRFNRFDNLYGHLVYENCIFDDFIPVRVDDDFHLYTGHDVIIMNGEIIVGSNDRALAQIGRLDNNNSSRPENNAKEWPNIFVVGTKLLRKNGVSDNLTYSIFHINGTTTYSGNVEYITHLKLLFSSDSDFSHFCIKEVDCSGVPHVTASNFIQRQLPDAVIETTYGNEGVGKYVKIINQ